MSKRLSYRDAGVDIDAGDALVERDQAVRQRTLRPEVLGGIGGFGALFDIQEVPPAGAGLGHRRRRHQAQARSQLGRHDTIGIDLVAMSVNDVLVQGAEPLFFLDYFAAASSTRRGRGVVEGIARLRARPAAR